MLILPICGCKSNYFCSYPLVYFDCIIWDIPSYSKPHVLYSLTSPQIMRTYIIPSNLTSSRDHASTLLFQKLPVLSAIDPCPLSLHSFYLFVLPKAPCSIRWSFKWDLVIWIFVTFVYFQLQSPSTLSPIASSTSIFSCLHSRIFFSSPELINWNVAFWRRRRRMCIANHRI